MADSVPVAVEGERPGPKLRRSCEACRSSKGRCLPSKSDNTRCERCLKVGKKCVFLETKPRPKKMRSSKIRVAEMEQKLDGILSLLAAKTQEETESTPSSHTTSTSSATMQLDLAEMLELPFSPMPMGNPKPFQPFHGTPSFGLLTFLDHDVITKGIVTVKKAEAAIKEFESRAFSFPFVTLPPNTSLDILRQQRPFLLLAVLAVTAQSNMALQSLLEHELRETLGRRVIVRGERSIDLLQGLLVYLAWYRFSHIYTQQLFQLTQMSNAMAIDLKLHKPSEAPRVTNSNIFDMDSQMHFPANFATNTTASQLEQKRTLVGCYCLTSPLCRGLRKPNSLKYHDYIEECSELLAKVKFFESDTMLPYFTRLHKLGDEINDAFDYSNHGQLAKLDPVRVEILSKSFAQQFQEMQRSFPTKAWNNPLLRTSYYHLRTYVNEIGLHAQRPDSDQFMMPQSLRNSWYHSSARTETLIRCLQSAKEYLDIWLNFTAADLDVIIAPNYLDLFYVLLLLGKFTEGCDAPTLNGEQIRQAANLRHYLDTFTAKFDGMLVYVDGQVQKNSVWNMKLLCEELQRWTLEVTAMPPCSDQPTLSAPCISFTEIVPSIRDLCTDIIYQFANSTQDGWPVEMANGWPPQNLGKDFEMGVNGLARDN
ncbi:hypothetical protein CJF32_00005890 [Rutstroemia sp. NJR-2017a WRK4]|nr:hypothetical protein CJF32_00005890 [Rutstroemia sp. NJR-2017a WRK4]